MLTVFIRLLAFHSEMNWIYCCLTLTLVDSGFYISQVQTTKLIRWFVPEFQQSSISSMVWGFRGQDIGPTAGITSWFSLPSISDVYPQLHQVIKYSKKMKTSTQSSYWKDDGQISWSRLNTSYENLQLFFKWSIFRYSLKFHVETTFLGDIRI